jgi:5-methylcytosine-specific restriction endonuclease McrA
VRKIPRPSLNTRTTYVDCISDVTDAGERAAYLSIADEVQTAGDTFEAAVTSLTLHRMAAAAPVAANITTDKLKEVYTVRMVARAAGRKHYNTLLASAPFGTCPLCSIGEVSTLDHYAPKSRHPMLAVVPINLVPACSICNLGKHDDLPSGPTKHNLHPYLDDFTVIDDHQWLVAEINHTSPASFKFLVSAPPPAWTPVLAERVRHHFGSFELDRRFALRAANQLVSIRYSLDALYAAGGAADVQNFLRVEAESRRRAQRNSWDTAMYSAMAADPWFANGGFR